MQFTITSLDRIPSDQNLVRRIQFISSYLCIDCKLVQLKFELYNVSSLIYPCIVWNLSFGTLSVNTLPFLFGMEYFDVIIFV